jgi:16S rRNA (adenine1518-N6/adenine1519-N6)-dimethyltransferase
MPRQNHDASNYLPAKKHLAQHFLIDPRIKEKIIDACGLNQNDVILEIGPGKGALTQAMADRAKHIYAVEIDRQLCCQLQESLPAKNVTIIPEDILQFDPSQLPRITKVVGNLPYNISTPIIEKLIEQRRLFRELYLMVQWEFGRRMAAPSGSKEYGSLSCYVQYYFSVDILFRIKNTCFRPVPKVMSCFLKLTPRDPILKARDEQLLFSIIRTGFQQRRKKILNAIRKLYPPEVLAPILAELKIGGNSRPEEITLNDYISLTNLLKETKRT